MCAVTAQFILRLVVSHIEYAGYVVKTLGVTTCSETTLFVIAYPYNITVVKHYCFVSCVAIQLFKCGLRFSIVRSIARF